MTDAVKARAINRFVNALTHYSLPSVFNPYHDHCEISDRYNAVPLRRRNLRLFLHAILKQGPCALWIARDLGYRGGRRTGIPMTDDYCLATAQDHYDISGLVLPVKGNLIKEQTASLVWSYVIQSAHPVMLWNIFPFHPHREGDPHSNRCHTAAERKTTADILPTLTALLTPETIVTIGNEAAKYLPYPDIPSGTQIYSVRHPSYGGRTQFCSQMEGYLSEQGKNFIPLSQRLANSG